MLKRCGRISIYDTRRAERFFEIVSNISPTNDRVAEVSRFIANVLEPEFSKYPIRGERFDKRSENFFQSRRFLLSIRAAPLNTVSRRRRRKPGSWKPRRDRVYRVGQDLARTRAAGIRLDELDEAVRCHAHACSAHAMFTGTCTRL